MCDGFYWPISFATSKDNLGRDAKKCERSCGVPARLYYHENPGQEPEEMEDERGRRYKDLKTAYLYRTQYVAACACRPQPWDEAALVRHQTFAELAARKGNSKLTQAEIKQASKISSKKSEVARQAAAARRERTSAEAVEAAAQLAAALPAELLGRSAARRQSLLWHLQPVAKVLPAAAHQSLLKHVSRNAQAPVSSPGAVAIASPASTAPPSRIVPASGPHQPAGAGPTASAHQVPETAISRSVDASPRARSSATAQIR